MPESLNHFQQVNSGTIQGVTAPGVTLGDAVDELKIWRHATLPQGYSIDYAGLTRQYEQEIQRVFPDLRLCANHIFLSLAAQLESFAIR